MKNINFKNKKGITLIALVVTIIVLLILAGVSIATITGENGLLEKAELAKEETSKAQELENNTIGNYEKQIDEQVTGTRGDKVQVVTAWSGENTSGTVSLGNYNISDYDFVLLTAKSYNVYIQTQLYHVSDITVGTSIIGVTNDSYNIWYTVTDDSTLTFTSRNGLSLASVKLIKI